MTILRVVIDTNVFVSALLSQRGAAYKLIMLSDSNLFRTHVSVPLIVEYEDAAKRILQKTTLTHIDLNIIIDFICNVSHCQEIYFLWRPFLRDSKDDMILELAIAARCHVIVTYNMKDFAGVEMFGLEVLTPQAVLQRIGQDI